MWETIKNDPILKTVVIIIFSVLGFGFAFNIMFGSRGSGMENGGEMGGSGYSLENVLSNIFNLSFKILLIVLVIYAIVVIFKYLNKLLSLGGEEKVFDKIKNDPILKGASVVVLVIAAIGLIYYLFTGLFGFGGGNMMGNGYNMMGSYGYGLNGFLGLLLQILLFVFIVGLIVGVIMYVKQIFGAGITAKLSTLTTASQKYHKCTGCGKEVSDEFKFCPNCGENSKNSCVSCGLELKSEWKCCPACGKDIGVDESVDNKQ